MGAPNLVVFKCVDCGMFQSSRSACAHCAILKKQSSLIDQLKAMKRLLDYTSAAIDTAFITPDRGDGAVYPQSDVLVPNDLARKMLEYSESHRFGHYRIKKKPGVQDKQFGIEFRRYFRGSWSDWNPYSKKYATFGDAAKAVEDLNTRFNTPFETQTDFLLSYRFQYRMSPNNPTPKQPNEITPPGPKSP